MSKNLPKKKRTPLSELASGEKATIVSIQTSSDMLGRLMGMGLFNGTVVQLLQNSSSRRKPILLAVGETRIAVSKEIARLIFIENDHS